MHNSCFASLIPPSAGLSASSFGFGLFEGEGTLGESKFEPVFVLSDTTEQDNILQYYENCDLYVEMVDNNDTANLETEIYMSMILPDIAADLTRALTVNGAWQVTEDEAFGIYAACQFDATIFDKTDEWCSFFTQQQIEDFEYAEGTLNNCRRILGLVADSFRRS